MRFWDKLLFRCANAGARRIAANIAKLPELLGVDAQLPHPSVKRNDGKAHFVFEIGRPVHVGC